MFYYLLYSFIYFFLGWKEGIHTTYLVTLVLVFRISWTSFQLVRLIPIALPVKLAKHSYSCIPCFRSNKRDDQIYLIKKKIPYLLAWCWEVRSCTPSNRRPTSFPGSLFLPPHVYCGIFHFRIRSLLHLLFGVSLGPNSFPVSLSLQGAGRWETLGTRLARLARD